MRRVFLSLLVLLVFSVSVWGETVTLSVHAGRPGEVCGYVNLWPGLSPLLGGCRFPFGGRVTADVRGDVTVEATLVEKGRYSDVVRARKGMVEGPGRIDLILGPTGEGILEALVFTPNFRVALLCGGRRVEVPLGALLAPEGSVWRRRRYEKAMDEFSPGFLARAFSWDRRLFMGGVKQAREEFDVLTRVRRSYLERVFSTPDRESTLSFTYGAVGPKPLRGSRAYMCRLLKGRSRAVPGSYYPYWLRFPVFEARLPSLTEVLRTPSPVAEDVYAAKFYHALFCRGEAQAALGVDGLGRWRFSSNGRFGRGERLSVLVTAGGVRVNPENIRATADRALLEKALASIKRGKGSRRGADADLYAFDPFTLHVLSLARAWRQRGVPDDLVLMRALDYLTERTSFLGVDQVVVHGVPNPFVSNGCVLVPGDLMAQTRRGSCAQRAFLTYAVARALAGSRASLLREKCSPRSSHFWVRVRLEGGGCLSVSNGKVTSCDMDFEMEPFMLPAFLKARFGGRCRVGVVESCEEGGNGQGERLPR